MLSGKRYAVLFVLSMVVSLCWTGSATAQQACGGFVFDDPSTDGDWDPATEDLLSGVRIDITDASGARVRVETGDQGAWSAPDGLAFPIQVDAVPPAHLDHGPSGPDAGLVTQYFDTAAKCAQTEEGNFGLYDTSGLCNESLEIITTCFVVDAYDTDGDTAIVRIANRTTDNGSTTATSPADWASEPYEQVATIGEVGSVHGVAVAADGTIYASSFVKRFSRSSSSLNQSANPTVVFEVRPGQRPEVLAVVDPSATVARDGDAVSMAAVFTQGLGDLQLAADEQSLYTVQLDTRELIEIGVVDGTVTDRVALDGPTLGITDCAVTESDSFGDLRPFGLGLDRSGELLIGVVCSAESSVRAGDFPVDRTGVPAGDASGLHGYVYSYDGSSLTRRLDWPLAGDRGQMQVGNGVAQDASWHPWISNYPYEGVYPGEAYPQPAITDLSVDAAGELIVAIGDRWGHQNGPALSSPAVDGELRRTAEPLSSGDLQRACAVPGGWVIEGSTDDCTGGIGDREHFTDDRYGIHDETSFGSVAHLPGTNEIVATHMDPIPDADTWQSGGLIWHDTTSGSANRGLRLYDGRHARVDGTFEKATGLGGLAVGCAPAPVELAGNVWFDEDDDGRRSPSEPEIVGAVMQLLDSGGTVIAEQRTDATGQYRFAMDDDGDPLRPNVAYRVALDDANYGPDGAFGLSGSFPGLQAGADATSLGLAAVGSVDHDLDFAMTHSYDLALVTEVPSVDLEAGLLTIAVHVRNQSSVPSGSFQVATQLPSGFSFVAATRTVALDPATGLIEWTVDETDSLAVGDQRTVEIVARFDSPLSLDRYVVTSEIAEDSGDDRDSTPDRVLDGPNGDKLVELTALPDGFTDRLPSTVDEDDHDAATFGIAEVGGRIAVDTNRSAAIDDGDETLEGVVVVLANAAGDELASTTSGAYGGYVFSHLPPGDYQIIVPASPTPSAASTKTLKLPVALVGESPENEEFASPSGTLDRASDLTVDVAYVASDSSRLPPLFIPLLCAAAMAILIIGFVAIRWERRRIGRLRHGD